MYRPMPQSPRKGRLWGNKRVPEKGDSEGTKIFKVLYEVKDETFGNARLARNLFEHTVNNQANRIIALAEITDELLSTIEVVDIPRMLQK